MLSLIHLLRHGSAAKLGPYSYVLIMVRAVLNGQLSGYVPGSVAPLKTFNGFVVLSYDKSWSKVFTKSSILMYSCSIYYEMAVTYNNDGHLS